MCEALRELMKDDLINARAEGIAEGEARGFAKGEARALKQALEVLGVSMEEYLQREAAFKQMASQE